MPKLVAAVVLFGLSGGNPRCCTEYGYGHTDGLHVHCQTHLLTAVTVPLCAALASLTVSRYVGSARCYSRLQQRQRCVNTYQTMDGANIGP